MSSSPKAAVTSAVTKNMDKAKTSTRAKAPVTKAASSTSNSDDEPWVARPISPTGRKRSAQEALEDFADYETDGDAGPPPSAQAPPKRRRTSKDAETKKAPQSKPVKPAVTKEALPPKHSPLEVSKPAVTKPLISKPVVTKPEAIKPAVTKAAPAETVSTKRKREVNHYDDDSDDEPLTVKRKKSHESDPKLDKENLSTRSPKKIVPKSRKPATFKDKQPIALNELTTSTKKATTVPDNTSKDVQPRLYPASTEWNETNAPSNPKEKKAKGLAHGLASSKRPPQVFDEPKLTLEEEKKEHQRMLRYKRKEKAAIAKFEETRARGKRNREIKEAHDRRERLAKEKERDARRERLRLKAEALEKARNPRPSPTTNDRKAT